MARNRQPSSRPWLIGGLCMASLAAAVALWRVTAREDRDGHQVSPVSTNKGRQPPDTAMGTIVTLVDQQSNGQDAFAGPFGICLGPDNNLYVSDDLAHRIVVISRTGQLLRTLGSHGHGPGQVAWLDAVDFGPQGMLYIADTGTNRIQIWRPDGTFIREFGRRGVNPPGRPLANPRDVLVDGDLIYVADFNGNCIQIYDLDGRSVQLIEGSGQGRLKGPIQLARSRRGTLFVSELHNHRVQEFDRHGKSLQRFGNHGSGEAQLQSPHGLTFGPDELLYVADYGNHRVQVFSDDGQYVRTISDEASAEGRLKHPTDLCFDQEGRLYIVDKGHRRIAFTDVDLAIAKEPGGWGRTK